MTENRYDDPRVMAEALFADLGLRGEALRLGWVAFEENAEGTIQLALSSFEGQNPAGVFEFRRRRGDHQVAGGQRRTGWRFVRGTHGGTYVRDPRGVDTPPPGYDLTTRGGARQTAELERPAFEVEA